MGYMTGTEIVAQGEYRIQAMSDVDAIKYLAFGMFDASDNTNSILDFDNSLSGSAPLYQIGENGYFGTPEAAITNAANAQNFGGAMSVAAGKTATLRFARMTLRVVT